MGDRCKYAHDKGAGGAAAEQGQGARGKGRGRGPGGKDSSTAQAAAGQNGANKPIQQRDLALVLKILARKGVAAKEVTAREFLHAALCALDANTNVEEVHLHMGNPEPGSALQVHIFARCQCNPSGNWQLQHWEVPVRIRLQCKPAPHQHPALHALPCRHCPPCAWPAGPCMVPCWEAPGPQQASAASPSMHQTGTPRWAQLPSVGALAKPC